MVQKQRGGGDEHITSVGRGVGDEEATALVSTMKKPKWKRVARAVLIGKPKGLKISTLQKKALKVSGDIPDVIAAMADMLAAWQASSQFRIQEGRICLAGKAEA